VSTMAPTENGWNEYSRLVLEQLEVLSISVEGLRSEMQELRQELAIIKAKETQVAELKIWKEKIEDFASPRQMRLALSQIEELKIFKTKAVTIFMVVQAMVGGILAWAHLL
jgi:hypothetical protein